VEQSKRNNISHLVTAPAQVSSVMLKKASEVAMKAIATFDGLGNLRRRIILVAGGSFSFE
jgi:phosphoribosylaminoimidazole carboxylase (NCAIR synthetase)